MSVTSYYAKKGDEAARLRRLLRGAIEEVNRLASGMAQGWDVKEDLDRAVAQASAYQDRLAELGAGRGRRRRRR